jgi:uncharacterized protein
MQQNPQSILQSPQFIPLPLGAVRPAGWLARQLRIQADGISGHLDEFWPDIKDSQWFGGHTEGWERAPYWLDGIVPLAYLLDDDRLKEKVSRHLGYIIEHQEDDGWLGPRQMVVHAGAVAQMRYDLWGQLLATKVLYQYAEASGDPRAVTALANALRCMDRVIDRTSLFNWGQYRWFEGLIALYWLYERTGEPWLIDLAVKLQAQGFDWRAFFARWPMTEPTPMGRWNFMGHVVNNAEAPKAPALWWRLSGDEADRAAAYDIIAKLDRYHGMVTGVFSGDECVAGKRPTQGTELCAVVEYAYSLEVLLSIIGDPAFGDRLEKIVFNALPATFSPDMWSHQYDQQVNQVECSVADGWPWNTNGPASNTFGVEPNFGCCTANLSQGWPKFAANLWMRPADEDGLAAVAYAPSRLETTAHGVPVAVELATGYPFRDELCFTVTTAAPVSFLLLLRIPGWAKGATVTTDGAEAAAQPGTFHRLSREWTGSTAVTLRLPMAAELRAGYNAAVAVERGPLVYALKMGEDWRRINTNEPYRELPHADWEIYPTAPWNYALDVAPDTLDRDVRFIEKPIGDRPFSPEAAPVVATVRGQRVEAWQAVNGCAGDAPVGPVRDEASLEEVTLIPYGCTNLRITEFPRIERPA